MQVPSIYFVISLTVREGNPELSRPKDSSVKEIAYRKDFIDKDQFCKLAEQSRKSG